MQGGGATRSVSLTVADPERWNLLRVECKMTSGTAGSLTIYNDTDGTSATVIIAAVRTRALPITFGSSFKGDTDMAHWPFFAGIVKPAEVIAHEAQVLAIAAEMGIVENTWLATNREPFLEAPYSFVGNLICWVDDKHTFKRCNCVV